MLKDKVHKTAIKPATMYGAECWAVRKKERRLHTTERHMLVGKRQYKTRSCEKCIDVWKEAHR